jgi:CCR4-NOT transcriptional regulation complex NOT5 subunit
LQRHRDFFKQLIKDGEIKDKTKMQEGRRLIEDQMEKFRELEKEYKQRKLTKVVFQNHNEIESKFISDSGEESDGEPREYNEYGEEDESPGADEDAD